MNLDALNRWILPLKVRVQDYVRRGIINAVDDSQPLQTMEVETLAGKVKAAVSRVGQYGFTSAPKPGAEAVVVNIGSNSDHSVIIACEDRQYRLKGLASGEVALYTDEGDKIHFKRGKIIDIETGMLTINATSGVNITTPTLMVSAKLNVGADLTVTGNETVGGTLAATGAVTSAVSVAAPQVSAGPVSIASVKAAFNSHTHTSAAAGSPTSPPSTNI